MLPTRWMLAAAPETVAACVAHNLRCRFCHAESGQLKAVAQRKLQVLIAGLALTREVAADTMPQIGAYSGLAKMRMLIEYNVRINSWHVFEFCSLC